MIAGPSILWSPPGSRVFARLKFLYKHGAGLLTGKQKFTPSSLNLGRLKVIAEESDIRRPFRAKSGQVPR